MAQHSVGLTRNIHAYIRRIKKDHGVTMEGFANIALESILNSQLRIREIVKNIEENELEKSGAIRLQNAGY